MPSVIAYWSGVSPGIPMRREIGTSPQIAVTYPTHPSIDSKPGAVLWLNEDLQASEREKDEGGCVIIGNLRSPDADQD